ncbi:hypothetical protein DFP74_0302 [Nocardiopsis sp. Huas11]|nr:hypothetical protein DFP74_0302 [Nocardiopsis sp. Huas11]
MPGTVYTALPDCAEALPTAELEEAAGSGSLRITGELTAGGDSTRLACDLAPHDWSEMRFRAEVEVLEPDDPQLAEHRAWIRAHLDEAEGSLAEEEIGAFTIDGWTYENGVWRSVGFGDGGISFAVSDIETDEADPSPMIMAATAFTMGNLIVQVSNERHSFEAREDLRDTIDRTEAIAALVQQRVLEVGETD